jgi:cobalt-precorrin 5A hydrolase
MTEQVDPGAGSSRRLLVLGLGCERGASPVEVIALASQALAGLDGDLACIATLDSRSAEPALVEAARYFSVPLATFDSARLECETPRLANPSALVFAHAGCHGVAEAAALAAAGPDGRLLVPKIKSAHATAAICESFQMFARGSSQADSGPCEIDSAAVMECA